MYLVVIKLVKPLVKLTLSFSKGSFSEMDTNDREYRRLIESLQPTENAEPVEEPSRQRRKEARALIASALRIIRDTEKQYQIRPSETIKALATLHQDAGNYNASKHLYYASKQMRRDENR